MPDLEVLAEAAEVLRRGGLVAFPTETVYGLGANALDERAVRRIFEAKGRPSFNPLIVHVPDVARARSLVSVWPDAAQRLAERFWPGPLTMVLPKRPEVPDVVTAGLPTVAVRIPAHPVAAALLEAAGIPVAAPSANRYTALSPTSAEHVLKGLADRIDVLVDGGATDVGIESAVVDLSGDRPVLLRPGSIAPHEIEAVVGAMTRPEPIGRTTPRPSPGMVERHYAPHARVLLVRSGEIGGDARLRENLPAPEHVGALVLGAAPGMAGHVVRMPDEPIDYARRLYAALHEMDARGCEVVLVEEPPMEAAWSGVLDRLRRAAA